VGVGWDKTGAGEVVPFGEVWDGVEWVIAEPLVPAEAVKTELGSVSCISAKACYAVGHYKTAAGAEATLAEMWNGTRWKIMPSQNVAGSPTTDLEGVACASATVCKAVGYAENGSEATPISEKLSSGEWVMEGTPAVEGKARLLEIDCPSTSSCFAVGTATTNGSGQPLIEHWAGTAWAVQAGASAPSGAGLFHISCATTATCVAIGLYGEEGWAERWNGKEWVRLAIPPTPEYLQTFQSISCPSASECMVAGGGFAFGKPGFSFVEHWNGTEWLRMTTPASEKGGSLSGVYCTSTTACEGVGSYKQGNTTVALTTGFGPPSATTEGAESTLGNVEKLQGSIAPSGWETKYHFEYGLTTSYGASAPIANAALSSETRRSSAEAYTGSLGAGQIYHYRLVAISEAGTNGGADHTFVAP
jgi:hypothetical protein